MAQNISALTPIILPVDDTNPRILYTGDWYQSGTNAEYMSTSHSTHVANSTVSVKFNGTLITVFGTLKGNSGQPSFILDEQEPQNFVPPNPPPSTPEPLFSFQQFPVSYGEHQLTIKTTEATTFTLDYFQITTPNSTDGRGYFDNVDSSTETPVSHKSPPRMPAGVIAGIVIAIVVMIALIILIVFLVRRRCRRTPASRIEKGKNFDILESEPSSVENTFRGMKWLGRIPAVSKSQTSSFPGSQATQSSAMFTSVIFITPPTSSRSGPQSNTNTNRTRSVQ